MRNFFRILASTMAILMIVATFASCAAVDTVKDMVSDLMSEEETVEADVPETKENDVETDAETEPEESIPTVETYTVTFADYDGTVLATVTDVQSGASVTAPTAPTRSGYRFTGWDKAFDNVTSNITVTAQYAETDPTIVISEVTASAGDKNVEVTVALEKNPGVASLVLSVEYDSAALKLTKVAYNTAIGGQTVPSQVEKNPAKLYWVNGFSNAEGDWVFATLTFDVAANATAGDHDIKITYDPDNVYNIDEDNVTFDVVNGKVTVK